MNMKRFGCLIKNRMVPAGVVVVIFFMAGCHPFSDMERTALKKKAGEINAVFIRARSEIGQLKSRIVAVLDSADQLPGLYNKSRYTYTKNYVYHTPLDDGHCEVWASAHMPIGISERRRIKSLEHFCPDLKSVYHRNAFIDTVYLTTYDSIVMGFPYADIHA